MVLLEVVGDGGASLSCHHLARVFPSRCPSVVTAKEREKGKDEAGDGHLLVTIPLQIPCTANGSCRRS